MITEILATLSPKPAFILIECSACRGSGVIRWEDRSRVTSHTIFQVEREELCGDCRATGYVEGCALCLKPVDDCECDA